MNGSEFVAVAGLALLLSACIPTSKQPLTKHADAIVDQRLSGLWSQKKGDERIYAHFLPGDGADMEIITISARDGGSADWNSYTMFPSRLGDARYMNVLAVSENGKPVEEDEKDFYFIRYQVSDDGAFRIWGMNPKLTTAAIEGKLLKGTVHKGRYVDTIKITASTKNWPPTWPQSIRKPCLTG